MSCFSGMENAPIAHSWQFRSGARVVDVGGSHGGFLAEVLKTDPSLRGVLFDLAEVVQAPRALHRAGLARCELTGGDFFMSLPPDGDVYIFKRLLHDSDDDT